MKAQNVITSCRVALAGALKTGLGRWWWGGIYCFFSGKCHVTAKQQPNLLGAFLEGGTLKEKKNIVLQAATSNRPLSIQMCLVSLVSDVSFLISRPADRREAVLLPSLQQGVRRQVQSQGSPTDPFGCEKIPMQELLQNLLQDVSSAQA